MRRVLLLLVLHQQPRQTYDETKRDERSQENQKKNSPSLSLRLQKRQNVIDSHGALDVSDDGSVRVVHEFDSDLGDTTSGAGSAEDLLGVDRLVGTNGRRRKRRGNEWYGNTGGEIWLVEW